MMQIIKNIVKSSIISLSLIIKFKKLPTLPKITLFDSWHNWTDFVSLWNCMFFISSSFDLPNLKKSQKLKTVFYIFAMYMDNFIVTWVGVVDYHSNYISVNH